jgi:hypothetical protein
MIGFAFVRDYVYMNKNGLVKDMNNMFDFVKGLSMSCEGRFPPGKKSNVFNEWDNCLSTWADIMVADRRSGINFEREETDWAAFSKDMDIMIKGWLSQKTYCHKKSSYTVYASLSAKNFRQCSDTHTNFFKGMKDLMRDVKDTSN